jgi:hypothetical protein
MLINRGKYKKGTSLVETVVYTSLLAVLATVAVTSLLLLNRSLQNIVISRIVDDASQEIMEKVIREIRFANSVDVAKSTLSVNPSVLVLDSTTSLGVPTEVEFSLSGNTLVIKRDDVLLGPLTPNQVEINEVIFDHIVTPESEAVKVSIVLIGQKNAVYIEERFNTTVVLRGSY